MHPVLISPRLASVVQRAEARMAESEMCARFEAAQQIESRVDLFDALCADGQDAYAPELIATVEDCSPQAAQRRLSSSITLVRALPVTLHLLKDSRIPLATATAVAEAAVTLSAEQCQGLEARLWRQGFDTQPSATARQATDAARKTRTYVTSVLGTEAVAKAALAERDVRAWGGEPGTDTAVVQATLHALDATLVMGFLDAAADAKTPEDPRSKGAVRCDTLVEAITGQSSFALWTDAGAEGPMPGVDLLTLQVRVPLDVHLETITGHDQTPGILPRQTMLTPATAALIAQAALTAGGRVTRLVTDPLSGRLLDTTLIGTGQASKDWAIALRVETQYEPSEALKRFVRLRDGHCLFPGCSMPAQRCEIDHAIPYDHQHPERGGQTTAANLGCLCKRHHLMKHTDGWTMTRHPDGSVTWTTPTGRHITTPPPDLDP